jgi:cytochrome c peroxidase
MPSAWRADHRGVTSDGVALPSVISIAAESTQTEVQRQLQLGENPFPVHLQRPQTAPLSAVAEIGKRIFFDPSLSASGSLSCSSCHSPDHFYGPIGAAPAVFSGRNMSAQGTRGVPSLMYLERQLGFSVGPDKDENEDATLAQMVAQGQETPRATKKADNASQAAANLVPQGGLFWGGRADTLPDQAIGPMLNPLEMANVSVEGVACSKTLGHQPTSND